MTTSSLPRRRSEVTSRRVVQMVPAGTSAAVVVHLIRIVMDPDWSPAQAAADVAEHVRGDVALLRQARLRLLQCTRFRSTLAEARALATVNLAITSLEERLSA
jgi:hypothetical protein